MWSRCCCRGAKKIVAYPAFPQSKQEENPSSEPLSIPSKHPSTSHTLKKWLDRILAIKHHFPQRMGFFRGNRGFHLSCTTHGCTQCTQCLGREENALLRHKNLSSSPWKNCIFGINCISFQSVLFEVNLMPSRTL